MTMVDGRSASASSSAVVAAAASTSDTTTTTNNNNNNSNNNPTMSLLDKYATLNRTIDETRDELQNVQHKIQLVQEQTSQLVQHDRTTMQQQIATAQSDRQALQHAIDAAWNLHDNDSDSDLKLFQQVAQAQWECHAVQAQWTSFQTIQAQQRREFLEQSRSFRANCRKWQIAASSTASSTSTANDAPHNIAALEAYAATKMDPALASAVAQYRTAASSTKDDDDDDERHTLQTLLTTAQQAHQVVQQKYQTLKDQLLENQTKHAAQQQRHTSLQDQLARIQADTAALEQSIALTETKTAETQEMAQNYKSGMSMIMFVCIVIVIVISTTHKLS